MKDKLKKGILWLGLLAGCGVVNHFLMQRLSVPEDSYIKIGIGLLILEALAIWQLITVEQPYRADRIPITPDISTPAPAGQGQHGTARWLKEKEIKKYYQQCEITNGTMKVKNGGLVVGKKDMGNGRERIFFVGDDTHTITIGSTRSGKTRHEVLETIGLCGLAGESMLLTDIKGELYDYTAPFLREMGYNVLVVDYDEMERSDCYNPLQQVIDCIDQGDIAGAIDASWDIVSQMVGEPKGERIWTDGECSAIAGAIMAVCYDNRKEPFRVYQNMTNVYHFLVGMCTPVGKYVPLNLYRASLPDQHPCKAIFAVAGIAPERTRNSFYTAALMTLRLFTNPKLYHVTRQSSWQMEQIGKEKTAVFVILPEDRDTYNEIATIFIAQAYTQLSRLAKQNGGRLPRRVEMIWDEAGNFAKIPSFTQMLTVAGGKGIRFHLFLQDYAQLESLYDREAAKTIRNNCETKIYLRSADEETRESISKDLNEYTTKAYSLSYGRKRADDSSSSTSLIGRRLLTSEEIGRIQRPYSLIMRTGVHPAIMYAPDLSLYSFNKRFGMGDEEQNRLLRIHRHAERKKQEIEEIELWGIWNKYQDVAKAVAVRKEKEETTQNGEDI